MESSSQLPEKILQGMQQINCIPVLKCEDIELNVDDVDWTRPSQVLLGDAFST